jgi:hypothetical protein
MFIQDTESRIQDLRALLPESTIVATHTVPFPDPIRESYIFNEFSAFSDALRYVASKNDVLLFADWQSWILKSMLPSIQYLKDRHHPRYVYSKAFAKVLLSSANHFKSGNFA